ncbi:MAG: thioredoxin family protein [Burkholderiales bacterium]|nr:thioredoxin family protein [Phycisphaerae bacterium]
MLTADYLKTKFDAALSYDDYVATGKPEQQKRWADARALLPAVDAASASQAGYTRLMHVLVISGIWCGDCVQQCPLLEHIASGNPAKIALRFVDRDAHKDLSEQVKINGGLRVPTVIFMAEDFEFCALAGDRPISRYRKIAIAKLGASCPIGIAPPEKSEMEDTYKDWATEFERVQLMLRLSARLREKHGD